MCCISRLSFKNKSHLKQPNGVKFMLKMKDIIFENKSLLFMYPDLRKFTVEMQTVNTLQNHLLKMHFGQFLIFIRTKCINFH